jgi:hypothetical protein
VLLAGTVEARASDAADWSALASPDNSYHLVFLHGSDTLLNLTVGGWGPNWGWTPPPVSTVAAEDGVLRLNAPWTLNKRRGDVINVACEAAKAGERAIKLHYTLTADRDVRLTGLVATLTMSETLPEQKIVATLSDGTLKTFLPGANAGDEPATSKLQFFYTDGTELDADLEPATALGLVKAGVRIMLASGTMPQGSKEVSVTITTPADVDFVADDAGKAKFVKGVSADDWFPFTAKGDTGPSVIGMEDWMDAPAGKHGGVRMVGDHFETGDGKPIKFWGTNLAYASACAPEKKYSEQTAAKFAKYGINGVRLHKFLGPLGWAGINTVADATKFDPDALDRLDYMCGQLTKAGVYYGFSHTYDMRVGPDNASQLLSYDEIMKNDNKTMGLINFAPDIQDLLIQRLVTLLNHQNPYTGKTYAQDPALSYVEIQNEDDIFFFTTQMAFDKCPTYYKRVQGWFCDWLIKKYGSAEAVKTAWGDGLKGNESIEEKTIAVQGNPWYMGSNSLGKDPRQVTRLLDNAAFFHELQDQFYSRAVKAIRDTGYAGPLVGSPWQAPPMIPHYDNLLSDYEVGYIDRHDYFGEKMFDTMLTKPGSGFLGSGFQQVIDRPFGISEWIDCYPCLYTADGPPIMAAYGLGLQGWDASYEFQSSSKNFFDKIAGEMPYGAWNGDTPTQLGQFPTISRMVLRGDVKEGPIISTRRISPENLATGNFDFSDKIQQSGDIKTFAGSVPPAALAAGRDVVQFVDHTQPSDFPEMSKFTEGKTIKSATGQLVWDYSDKGFFTINTDGTKGLVGFAGDKDVTLGDVQIASHTPYASIIVTALDRGSTLGTTRSALVSAVARTVNTGLKYLTVDQKIIVNGGPPILMEPVKAKIAFGRGVAAVNVLDQDGRRTGDRLDVNDGAFSIDGAREKTLYYEVVFR